MKNRNEHGNCPHCNADLDGGSIWETFYQKALHGEYYGQQGRPAEDDEAQEIADLAAEQYGATRGNGRWGRAKDPIDFAQKIGLLL